MDDVIMNMFLNEMAKEIIKQRIIQGIVTPLCELCEERVNNSLIKNCVFCSKTFCPDCSGKKDTNICKVCNWTIANGISFPVLNKFSVKELRIISDNYKISISGIKEKRDLIETILTNFKKSIEGSNKPTVDVENLKSKMITLKNEEREFKENELIKEMERAKLFTNVNVCDKPKEDLSINFKPEDHIDLSVTDIPNMSVKEIKSILDIFNIDYTFALEKKELVDIAVNLTETYNKFRAANPKSLNDKKEYSKNKLECIICMDNRINSVFLNCAHSSCCYDCARLLNSCPICRGNIEKCLQIFIG